MELESELGLEEEFRNRRGIGLEARLNWDGMDNQKNYDGQEITVATVSNPTVMPLFSLWASISSLVLRVRVVSVIASNNPVSHLLLLYVFSILIMFVDQ